MLRYSMHAVRYTQYGVNEALHEWPSLHASIVTANHLADPRQLSPRRDSDRRLSGVKSVGRPLTLESAFSGLP